MQAEVTQSNSLPTRLSQERVDNSFEKERGGSVRFTKMHGAGNDYIYVYTPESETLQPLDTWLRSTDTSRPFYVGGTIDYHC